MIKFDIENRVAVVTGGAQGFGLAITERFIESGATVVIWDIDEEAIKTAINKINSDKVSFQVVDVESFENIEKNLAEVEKNHNKIDIFINNAGVAGKNTTVVDYPLEEWKKVIDLNLNAVFYCCKAVTPYMIKNNYGRIVNIASIAGKEGNPRMVPYSSTKAAVIALTKSVGKELAATNVLVNCVTPAVVQTKLLEEFTPEQIKYMTDKIPMGRTGEIKEIAALVSWLCSEECSFSTGAAYDASGGRATY